MTLATAPTMLPGARPTSGPVLFARYAYGPNRLGLCGPDAAAELLGETTTPGPAQDGALRHLARGFEGAWPYLQLIAREAGLADPLDPRVVEGYWLGGGLLDRVAPAALARDIDDRFRTRLRYDERRWLTAATLAGSRPSHAYHVLEVYPRLGLLRGGERDGVLETIDACRIRWGRVVERDDEHLVVRAVPLELIDGHLALGAPRLERIRAWRDGLGAVDGVVAGDVVTIHWDWACERLSASRLKGLIDRTTAELAFAERAFG